MPQQKLTPAIATSLALHGLLAGWIISRPPLVPAPPAQAARWIVVDRAPAPPAPPPVAPPAPASTPAPRPRPLASPSRPPAPQLPPAPEQAASSGAEEASGASAADTAAQAGAAEGPADGAERWPTVAPGDGGGGTVAVGPPRPHVVRLGDPGVSQEVVSTLASDWKSAQAEAPISAGYRARVEDTIVLPGVGEVRADKVCLTEDGAYRTELESFDRTVCDAGEYDHADSRRPQFRCTRSHVEHVDGRVIEAPATVIIHRCVEWKPSVDYYRPPCVRYADVPEPQLTQYTLETFTMDDYRHDRPIRTRKKIPTCPTQG